MPANAAMSTRQAEDQITKFREIYLNLRQDFLSDGRIDQEEQDILDRVEAKITTFEERVAEKQTGKEDDPSGEAETTDLPAASISGSVGSGGKNTAEDVTTIQQLLNQKGASLLVDGLAGSKTNGAIAQFQKTTLGFQDGRIDPDGKTWSALSGGPVTSSGQPPGNAGSAPVEDLIIGGDPGAAGHWESEEATIPEEQERRIKTIIDEHIPDEVPIIIDDGGTLAAPEIPFARNQEISVGCPFGELSIKFNDQGQVESAAMAVAGIPGATASAGAYGILGKIEVKPYTGKVIVSKPAGTLKIEIEVSASGSGFVGLGLGKGDAWGGIGIEIEVKVSRTEKITAELALGLLEEAVKSSSAIPGANIAFSLPVEIALNGSQSLVVGGSAPKGIISAASKITLKDYNSPMATLKISEANGSLSCEFKSYEGLTQMVEDVAMILLPELEVQNLWLEIARDIALMINDPERFAEEYIERLQEMERKLLSITTAIGEFADMIEQELGKIGKLRSEISAQLDEWAKDAKKGYDYLEDKAEEAQEYLEDKLKDAEGGLEDAKDFLEEKFEDAEDALEEASDFLEEQFEEAEEYLEDTFEDAEEAFDEAEDYLEDKVEEAEEYLEDKFEEAEEVLDDAEEAYDDAKDAVEDKAKELWNDAKGFF